MLRLGVFISIPFLFFSFYISSIPLIYYVTLILPFGFFLFLVNLYQRKKRNLLFIEKISDLIQRELHRKLGDVKQLSGRESWEYAEEIRNHPLSVDLDLCTKQGLIPFLDTTVSLEAWTRFQRKLLQIEGESPRDLQNQVKDILKNKTLTYQLMRKSILLDVEDNIKVSIHTHKTPPTFWKNRTILRKSFHLLGIFTPIWLVVASLFSLPFSTAILLINLLLFLSYRKDSSKIWTQITEYTKSINRFSNVWKRISPNKRESIQKSAKVLGQLGDSSEWIISPIPHFILNCLFLWDLWKISRFEEWYNEFSFEYEDVREKWIAIDSLLPMTNLAFLHPKFEFPVWNSNGFLLAETICHPLLNEKTRIDNPLPECQPGAVFIITGSNMSGKTTYIRSIAINILIAGSGGPVCGSNMSIPDFKIHTLIRSQDSLEDGISFFYSEVRRLAEIIRNTSNTQEISILFLDEILKGTNSRERQIATKEILDALSEKGAIVFLTTHDLQLAEINNAKIFHFTELEKYGEMIFDYMLRDGISISTNALRILKKEGIPIKSE